ncbi:MAG TPA: LamG domain-containing protein [Candidatus Lustribacter sp.]|nr:LamG domain-containing protein [Candidatus Lustribacter sp.]
MRTVVIGAVAAGLAAALVSAPATAAVPSAAVPSAIVLSYPFENLAGGIVRDVSPSRLDGMLVNTTAAAATSASVPGHGTAVALVGAGHQFVAVPEGNALDVDRYTLTALVRYTGIPNDQTLGRWEVLEKAGAYWMNVRTNGRVRVGGFYGSCTATSAWKFFDSTTAVPLNTWTHLAATYNGSTLTVWINGSKSGSMAVTGRTCSNNEPLAIGAKNAPSKGLLEAFWDGQLDDVRIYNRALSAAGIAALVPT